MDATAIWIIVIVVLLAVLVLVGVLVMRRRKDTQQVRDRFGPEYDRQVRERGSEKAARQHLRDVEERRSQLSIKPLSADSRARYLARWQAVQTDFVDRPGEAVDDAARLVDDVMDERGYPRGTQQERTDLMAADHPQVVEQYRAANEARHRHHTSQDPATTEELRRAMVHYRELVTLLVEDGDAGQDRDLDRDSDRDSDSDRVSRRDSDRDRDSDRVEDRGRAQERALEEDRAVEEERAREEDRASREEDRASGGSHVREVGHGDEDPRHRAE